MLILIMFILSGMTKLFNPTGEISRLQMKLLNNHGIDIDEKIGFAIIIFAGLWELVSVVSIAYSEYKGTGYLTYGKYGCISLMVFTVMATVLFYFPPDVPMKYYPFISNVNTLGGLLLLANKFIGNK